MSRELNFAQENVIKIRSEADSFNSIDYGFRYNKIMCDIDLVKLEYRFVQRIKDVTYYGKYRPIPDGTTHLYYDEFVTEPYNEWAMDRIVCTPIKIVDGTFQYYNHNTHQWEDYTPPKDFQYTTDNTLYHSFNWIVEDRKNPRMRTIPIMYQFYEYLEQYDFFNTYEQCLIMDSMSSLHKYLINLYVENIKYHLGDLGNIIKTPDDLKNLCYIIESNIGKFKTEDVEEFAHFVSSNKSLFGMLSNFIFDSDYKVH